MENHIKKCTKCHINKHMDFFYRDKNKATGRQSNCKECQDKATWKWRNGKGKKAYQSYKASPEANKRRYKRNRKRNKEYRASLNDNYIRELICKKSDNLKPEDISKELIDAHKTNLRLKRALNLTRFQEKVNPKQKGDKDDNINPM